MVQSDSPALPQLVLRRAESSGMDKTQPIALADLNLSFDARTRTYHRKDK